ncbi:MAG: hypothetical protein BGN86_06145 [Caulobacterales bacterium 68-7]|nr:MAG: hypothetical protein BGN86_06145 [Caulobacterales bacterium 68-7]
MASAQPVPYEHETKLQCADRIERPDIDNPCDTEFDFVGQCVSEASDIQLIAQLLARSFTL